MIQVTLYTKPGCHLCEDVKAELLALQQEIDFALQERNIAEHAADFERYRYLIPVVDIAHGPLLYAPIDPYDLRRTLQAAAKQSPEAGTP